MEFSIKPEPQEYAVIGDEESKSLVEAITDKQPQSLVLQEPPHLSDQSVLPPKGVLQESGMRRHPEFRALQSQLAHLRIENEGLRRQLDSHGVQRMPNELKWLLYFRAPVSKAQVLAIVRSGLTALFAKNPSFRGCECATFWAAQELSDWRAFRVHYVGFKLAAFRAAMKAAHSEA